MATTGEHLHHGIARRRVRDVVAGCVSVEMHVAFNSMYTNYACFLEPDTGSVAAHRLFRVAT